MDAICVWNGTDEDQCDPEAARSIFSNPELAAKTTLIPLDLTHQVLATLEVQQLLAGDLFSPVQLRHLFHEILLFFAHTYRDVFGLTKGPPLHDPLAVAVLLDGQGENLGFGDRGGESWHVTVVTDGLHSQLDMEQGQVGRTVISKAESGGVRIPRGVNVHRFWSLIESCMLRAEQAISP